ncbi:plasmid pRiA4b ORF-3 family protein [Halomonas halmophila]|uniref:Plasmid pRiA4b Orf3-like domain-containing protein n=1 Tax=Halomonas halmophila TaxID=252 RepID=A0A4Y4EX67_9GAMM|nr:plasmid pRiA4b ORF-3 family protein [Halomonas halmophila]GED21777.1 hypothetical protein HHA01_07540 [Halomonas halmophila]
MPDIQLRIELLDTDPLVWRRILVPEQITLQRLHTVIQAAMGWEDYHLFEFECNGRYYGEPDEWGDRPIAMARNAQLKRIAARAPDNTFHYMYDFGDGWEHRITVEATGLEETDPCPRLIDGAMACPLEDIGGIPGYEALKIAAAGGDDEHGKMVLEALEDHFDPYLLDEDEIDFMLEHIQAGFRRGGRSKVERDANVAKREVRNPRRGRGSPFDAMLEAQGIYNVEELMQAVQAEIDKNRDK